MKTNGQVLYELWRSSTFSPPDADPYDALCNSEQQEWEGIAEAFENTKPNPFRSPGQCDQPTGRQTVPDSSGWWWSSIQDDPVKVTKLRGGTKWIAWVANSPGFYTWRRVDELPKGWWEKMEKPK